MEFTVLGHAALLVTNNSTRLLIDPWLVGSCYWRSWWNLPEPSEITLENIHPTHIYLSHIHWDHFHGPTLRKFYKDDPVILLPKAPSTRLLTDLQNDFSFSNIKELSHGVEYHIGKDFALRSFQFQPFFLDSLLAMSVDNTVLLNANDCKILGSSLQYCLSKYESIDFVFRSHSSAGPIPHCIATKNVDDHDRKPSDYVNEFKNFARSTNAKFAIPFASSHCYLRPDTRKFNRYYSNPEQVANAFLPEDPQKCVVMPAGSSWNSYDGFSIKDFDYQNIKSTIQQYSENKSVSIQKQLHREKSTRLSKSSVEKYFTSFFKSIPMAPIKLPGLSGKMAFLVREVPTKSYQAVIINFDRKLVDIRRVSKFSDLMHEGCRYVILTKALILNDCCKKQMFNCFGPSKILRIVSAGPDDLNPDEVSFFLTWLSLFEHNGLPLYKLFTARQLRVWIRRFREPVDLFKLVLKRNVLRQPIAELYKSKS